MTNKPPNPIHTLSPFPFLNPTTRYHPITPTPSTTDEKREPIPDEHHHPPTHPVQDHGIYHVWRSRDNRKGRHAALVRRRKSGEQEKGRVAATFPRTTNSFAATVKGVVKMVTRFPVWDVSYDVAVVFTLGSIVWVINAFFVWLPLAAPSTEFPGETDIAGGWTAFIGATIFEFGSVLLMIEAVNENQTDCFGWALSSALESSPHLHPTKESCRHHHYNRKSWLSRTPHPSSSPTHPLLESSVSTPLKQPDRSLRKWTWLPTPTELRTHYLRELGFLACLAQFLGATVFWIAGFTGIPQVSAALRSTAAQNGAYWTPQVVGGVGFVVSGVLFMVEVQERWYKPAPSLLGWHVGFWNLVGAVGFTLCGALGFGVDGGRSVEYALTMATFVGSWAFLIGSIFQWYESLDKYPVLVGDVPF
ncbi:integral membrane protein [Podospora conica]|nr:integral membrane protein [Schizothecium conicum]